MPPTALSGYPYILSQICSYARHPELAALLCVSHDLFEMAGPLLYNHLVVVPTRHTVASPLSTFARTDYSVPSGPETHTNTGGGVTFDSVVYTSKPDFKAPKPSPFKLRLLDMVRSMDIAEDAAVRLAASHLETHSPPLLLPNLKTLIIRAIPGGERWVYKEDGADYTHPFLALGWQPETLFVLGGPHALLRVSSGIDIHWESIPDFTWPSVRRLLHICPVDWEELCGNGSQCFAHAYAFYDGYPNLTSYTGFLDLDARARASHYIYPYTPPATLDWHDVTRLTPAHQQILCNVVKPLSGYVRHELSQAEDPEIDCKPEDCTTQTFLPAFSGAALRDPQVLDKLVTSWLRADEGMDEAEIRGLLALVLHLKVCEPRQEGVWARLADADTMRLRDQMRRGKGGPWEHAIVRADYKWREDPVQPASGEEGEEGEEAEAAAQ